MCTLFGHGDSPKYIKPALQSTLQDLIENKKVTRFYIGHQGNFDYMAYRVLQELQNTYPHIQYYVVLAYRPTPTQKDIRANWDNTIFPEELANVPPHCSIVRRNRWMIDRADYVVAYITRPFGGATRFVEIAKKKNKIIIKI